MTRDLTLSIVGAGGDGAVVAGDILSMACAAEGLHVMKTEAYGPQIRGGESSCTVRISSEPILAQADAVDVLVVFSWDDFARFASEITPAPGATILYEASDAAPDSFSAFNLMPIAFNDLAREANAPKNKNIAALGVLCALFDLPAVPVRKAMERRFGKKAAEVIESNLRAFDHGAEAAQGIEISTKRLVYEKATPKLLMSGNEASAVAAIDAGCRFFAGYPITPSSEILHFLGEWLPRIGGTCLQTEDELAALGAVVGGSFAGVKSMTATSGPGLSLMAEMLGLASIAELPAVIVNVQRGGPSTGIPTKSEQSDLMHAVYAGHGDTPRVVIACSDVLDSYHATVEAFNLAEEFQIPVIVLSDQSIAQRRETLDAESLTHAVRDRRLATPEELTEYRRYRETEDGVSPMSVPGMKGGTYQTNGLEHDEQGRPSSMFITHERMNAKRYRKLETIAERYGLVKRYGPAKADLGILCWGSSAGPVREAIAQLNKNGARVAALVPQLIAPLPKKEIQSFIDDCRQILIVELSYSRQFHHYLRTEVDLPLGATHVHARSGGMSLTVSEIISAVESRMEVNV